MPLVLAGECRVEGAGAREGLVGQPMPVRRDPLWGGGPAAAPWRLPCVTCRCGRGAGAHGSVERAGGT